MQHKWINFDLDVWIVMVLKFFDHYSGSFAKALIEGAATRGNILREERVSAIY